MRVKIAQETCCNIAMEERWLNTIFSTTFENTWTTQECDQICCGVGLSWRGKIIGIELMCVFGKMKTFKRNKFWLLQYRI